MVPGDWGSQAVRLNCLLDRHERGLDVGRHRQEPSVEIFPFRSVCQQEKGLASKNQKPAAERYEVGHSVAPFFQRVGRRRHGEFFLATKKGALSDVRT